MRRIWISLLGLICVTPGLLLGAGPAASPAVPLAAKKSASLAGIDAAMQRFVEKHQISGAVTLVADHGKIVHLSAVGLADVQGQRPMQTDSVFAIASMTKPLTAAALMILVDEGKVQLDDRVSKYIPEFADARLKDKVKPKREIIVRDLLRHTSGLVSDQRNRGTLAETALFLAKTPLAFEPGTQYRYGPGLSVAGRVVEVISQQPFEQFLTTRILKPLGMSETTFHPSPALRARLAQLYTPAADKQHLEPTKHWLLDVNDATSPNPSGGLFSTAADLFKFHQMVLNGGEYQGTRILSEAAVRQMTSIQTQDVKEGLPKGISWGLGLRLVTTPQGPNQQFSVGSYGHGGAFGTEGWIDPQRGLVFLLLIQRMNFVPADADIRAELHRAANAAVGTK